MKAPKKEDYKICIIGLGYVGLPLAARFSLKGFNVTGFDLKEERVSQLRDNIDINNDISYENLQILSQKSKLTSNAIHLKECNIFIITVPTPINDDKTPDLKPLVAASELVASFITKETIVIYESTVYPGVTDDICTPILEKISGLTLNEDFSTGYSPERIVPGDKVNTIEKIKKVVSASNKEALKEISFLYSSIIDAGIYEATSIKVAEASKVTENIQRDVNIALINEMHQLYTSIGINTMDVVDAASTKWNFMKMIPGMVGGHCISIDPYYLMHKSEISGYTPNIMRASRKINDEMEHWVIKDFLNFLKNKNVDKSSIKVTILGYTFKENCNDIRNTKVKSLIFLMKKNNIDVNVWDPCLNHSQIDHINNSGIRITNIIPQEIELAFVCVYHREIIEFLNSYKGMIYDYRKIN